MQNIILNALFLVILLAISAFFSASEIALFSLSHGKVKNLVDKKIRNANLIEKLKNQPQELLITILIGNNIVNVLAASLATAIAIDAFGDLGIGIAAGIMSIVILLFGEIVPKSWAAANSQKIALRLIKPLYIIHIILKPIAFCFRFATKITSTRREQKKISEQEIRSSAILGFELGVVEKDEKEMIEKVFRLNDIHAIDIMTPWGEVFSLSSKMTVQKALLEFEKAGFSRAPIYENDEKNIIGVVHLKDIITGLKKNKHTPLEKIVFEAFVITSEERVDHLLQKFQKVGQHFAIIKNYHKQPIGIVTLEDVLEELVGEIEDESDE
ncbi:MAG: hemolysin family protein [Patescibacteria group bacterium]